MPAPQPKVNDKVRFRYTAPDSERPLTLEGKVLQFIIQTQRAIIEVKGTGVIIVPVNDIIRVL